jgi:hypothetical protein
VLVDDRKMAVFRATEPGASAYSIPRLQTVFSKALIECLNGGAGFELPDCFDDNYDPRWCVTSGSLHVAFEYHLHNIKKKFGPHRKVIADRLNGNAIIGWLDGKPNVDVDLCVVPSKLATQPRLPFSTNKVNPSSSTPKR